MELQTIKFRVYGIPKGQPRVKAFVRGNRAGVFTPPTANAWKDSVRSEALRVLPRVPLSGPIRFETKFVMPRPKYHFGKGKKANVLTDDAPARCRTKPDFDNLAKAVADVLNECGMWDDDALVTDHSFIKRYAAPGERSGCWISVEQIHDDDPEGV